MSEMVHRPDIVFAGACFVDMHEICKQEENFCKCNCHRTPVLQLHKNDDRDTRLNRIGYALHIDMPVSEEDSLTLVTKLYEGFGVTPEDDEEIARMVEIVHKFYHEYYGWSANTMLAYVKGKETA